MKRIAYLAASLLFPLAGGQDVPAPGVAAAPAATAPQPAAENAESSANSPEPPAAQGTTPGPEIAAGTGKPTPAPEEPLPVEILMASKKLALSDTSALLQAMAVTDFPGEKELPRHIAVVQRFNEDMQMLLTMLMWIESKEDADKVSAPAALLCRRGVELVSYFETEIAPGLTEEQQQELSHHVTPEQKQALTQVFQTLMEMMQTGFFGSESLKCATAPLLKSMLGVPSM